MTWREVLAGSGSDSNPYSHNSHNSHNSPPVGISANYANIANRISGLKPCQVTRLIEDATEGLSITPEQLAAELADDMDDIRSGALTPEALRLTAETLAVMRYPGSPRTEAADKSPHQRGTGNGGQGDDATCAKCCYYDQAETRCIGGSPHQVTDPATETCRNWKPGASN